MNVVQFIIDFAAKGDNAVIGRVSKLQSSLNSADMAASRLASNVGNNLKAAFMSLPGASFFTNPIVAMTAGIGAVSRLGMQAQTTATSFEVLLGSQEKSVQMLDEINTYAKLSPYDRLGAQDAAKTMLGFGVSAETVVSDLKLLGDVAGGDSNRLRQLALVFGQISAAGKLQGQDLLQLINAGYNPLLDIAEMTGKTMEEVRDEMSDGKISIDMVRQAFIRATSAGGRYHGMIDKLAESPAGKFGEMKDTALEAMLAIYDIVVPLIIPAFETLTATLDALIPVINGVASASGWLIRMFTDANPVVWGLTAAFGAYTAVATFNTKVLKGWTVAEYAHYVALLLVEKAQRLWNTAVRVNPVGALIGLITGLITALAICWNKFAGFRAVILTTWDTLKGFGAILKDLVVSNIQSLLQSIGALGEALDKLFKGDFSGAWQSVKTAGSLFADADGTQKALSDTKTLFSGIPQTYQGFMVSEQAKQKAKEEISEPEAAAGVDRTGLPSGIESGSTTGAGTATDMANSIATGGTRNTQITVNIQKFFDGVTVTSSETTDMSKLQRTVIESINRSLEIALSAAL